MNGAEAPATGSAGPKGAASATAESSQPPSSDRDLGNANNSEFRGGRFKLSFDPSPSLENSGSVARDHLANERTWLAYVRTSLAIASTGVALVQLFTISSNQKSNGGNDKTDLLRRFVKPLGATAVMIGLTVLSIGFWRYFLIQSALVDGKFPPARKTVGFLSSILVVIVAVTFGFLVGVPR